MTMMKMLRKKRKKRKKRGKAKQWRTRSPFNQNQNQNNWSTMANRCLTKEVEGGGPTMTKVTSCGHIST